MFVCFFSLFIFRRHSTREPASSRVTYFILPTQEPLLATTNTGTNRERYRQKDPQRGTDRKTHREVHTERPTERYRQKDPQGSNQPRVSHQIVISCQPHRGISERKKKKKKVKSQNIQNSSHVSNRLTADHLANACPSCCLVWVAWCGLLGVGMIQDTQRLGQSMNTPQADPRCAL